MPKRRSCDDNKEEAISKTGESFILPEGRNKLKKIKFFRLFLAMYLGNPALLKSQEYEAQKVPRAQKAHRAQKAQRAQQA